jgi:hypothetical protein
MQLKKFEEVSIYELKELFAASGVIKHDTRSPNPEKMVLDYDKIADIFCCTNRNARFILRGKTKFKLHHYKLLQVELSKMH